MKLLVGWDGATEETLLPHHLWPNCAETDRLIPGMISLSSKGTKYFLVPNSCLHCSHSCNCTGCSYFCSYYLSSAFYQMGSLSSKIFPICHSLGQVEPTCWEASEQPVRSSSEAGTLHRQILNHDHLVSRKPIWGLGQLINCRKTLPTWSSMLFLYSPAQSSPNQSSASLSASIWGEDKTTKIELMCNFMTLLSI